MSNTWIAAIACVLVTATAAAQQAPSTQVASATVADKGKMVLASNGARLGAVYRVGPDGSAQMIIDGKMVTIPASTLSSADGKLTTSLSKSEVLALH
jgi:hypothetical protein